MKLIIAIMASFAAGLLVIAAQKTVFQNIAKKHTKSTLANTLGDGVYVN